MSQMKYLRYEEAGIVLFEPHISHKVMHEVFNSSMDTLLSAGTTTVWAVDDELQVRASGGSITLNINSLPDDDEMIKRRLCLY